LPSAIGYTLRLRKKGSSATVAFLSLWQKAPGDVMGKRVWARENFATTCLFLFTPYA